MALNVTITRPSAAGYLTVFPAGSTPPTASSLNFTAAQTIANAVTVRVGAGGQISLIVNAGCADVLVDAVGYTTTPPTIPIVSTIAGFGPANDGSGSAVRIGPGRGVARDVAGNVYIADSSSHTIRKVTPAGVVSTLAGAVGQAACIDGVGATARFVLPRSVAVDNAGNVLVVDACSAVRRITPAGVVSTFAGGLGDPGNVDATGTAARFSQEMNAVAVNSSGTVFVGDESAIRRITPAGAVTTLAGEQGTPAYVDGVGTAARFSFIQGLAADAAGNVVVTDDGNFVVRRITAAGAVSTLAGTAGSQGLVDGTGSAARFGFMRGIALDAIGNAYVADTYTGTIRRVTPGGVVTTVAGAGFGGFADGTGSGARMYGIEGVASDSAGNLTVLDQGEVYRGTGRGATVLRRVSSTGVVTTVAGRVPPPGDAVASVSAGAAQFAEPRFTAVDPSGNVWVVDNGNDVIRRIGTDNNVTTVAGSSGVSNHIDGIGTSARFANPWGIVCDTAGNAYVVDNGSSTIRRITPAGEVTTLAGGVFTNGSADGTGSAARFNFPTALAIDASNNLYVSEPVSRTVRKVTLAGVVTTLAGSAGLTGTTDGTGSAARFTEPAGLTVDGSGNVYVSDYGRIRRITPAGVVTSIAGTAGVFGDVNATGSSARFSNDVPSLAMSPSGSVVIADSGNKTIRSMTPAGVVSYLAGEPSGGSFLADGTSGAARFAQPTGVAVDSVGRIVVADQWNHNIRRISFVP